MKKYTVNPFFRNRPTRLVNERIWFCIMICLPVLAIQGCSKPDSKKVIDSQKSSNTWSESYDPLFSEEVYAPDPVTYSYSDKLALITLDTCVPGQPFNDVKNHH